MLTRVTFRLGYKFKIKYTLIQMDYTYANIECKRLIIFCSLYILNSCLFHLVDQNGFFLYKFNIFQSS